MTYIARSACATTADFTNTYTATGETVTAEANKGWLGYGLQVAQNNTASTEVGVRKELVSDPPRRLQFFFKIDSAATLSGDLCIVHTWRGNYTADLFEIRLDRIDSTTFNIQLQEMAGSTIDTGATTLQKGVWYKVCVSITNSAMRLYLDDVQAPECELTGLSLTGYNINVTAVGKYYAQGLNGNMYFDNFLWLAEMGATPTDPNDIIEDVVEGYMQRLLAFEGCIVRNKLDGINNSYAPAPDTVSEANPYALMYCVQVGDQTTFDLIETWTYNNLDRRNIGAGEATINVPTRAYNLMGWHYNVNNSDGNGPGTHYDGNFATDADVDRVTALFWAHYRWGSAGSINYRQRALDILADIEDHALVTVGTYKYMVTDDFQIMNATSEMNMSYHSWLAFRMARRETTSSIWDNVIAGSYDTLEQSTGTTGTLATTSGFPPNWHSINNTTGVVGNPPGYRDTNFTYDAVRTLWRVYLDYLFYNATEARDYLRGNIYTTLNNYYDANSQTLPTEWYHDGTLKGAAYENTMFYALYYFVFVLTDTAQAETMYDNKIFNTYVQHPAGSFFSDNPSSPSSGKPSYFTNSWALFSTMTKEGYLQNFGGNVRRNIVPNPRFQTDLTGWGNDADYTLNAGTGGALGGGYVSQVSTGNYANFTTVNAAPFWSVQPSTDYVVSFYYKVPSYTSGNMPNVQMSGDGPYGTFLASAALLNVGNTWTRFTMDFNSGAFDEVALRIYNNGGTVSVDYSNFMLELKSTEGAWFDGASTGTNKTYAWEGTAHNSASTETSTGSSSNALFSVDGVIKGTNTKTFTVDAIVSTSSGSVEEDAFIYETMASAPSGTLIGSATYVTGYTRLTSAVNDQDGQLEYSYAVPTDFIIEADFSANGSADANYVYWGCSTTPETEDADFDGYIVALDEYAAEANKIQLQFGGALLASAKWPYTLGDNVRRAVKIVKTGTRIYIYVDNVLCIDYTDTSRVYGGNLIGVGARTGGLNAEHRCHKLYAYPTTSEWHPVPIEGGLSDLAVRSIDVMKLTKDVLGLQPTDAQIDAYLDALANNFNLTHIAIAIPMNIQADYDANGETVSPRQIPQFFQAWCDAIHERNINIIFRPALIETEVGFGTGTGLYNSRLGVGVARIPAGTPASAPTDGQATILGRHYSFITSNPTLFVDGDIWAPMPERTENNVQTVNITSITRSGSTATVTTSGNHNVQSNQPVDIEGADQTAYNGSFLIQKINDTQFTYTVSGTPTTPATGTMTMTFGVSPYDEENSWFDHTGGATTRYTQIFNYIKQVADTAFDAIGKDVITGRSANNFSEIETGWLPNDFFTNAGIASADWYGSDHTPLEMYFSVVRTYQNRGVPFDHQEWSDYWNGALGEEERTDYLVNMYNTFTQLKREGIYVALNYWGGWVGGVGEGILVDQGTVAQPAYGITYYGEILQSYFGEPEVGVITTPGFYLNGVRIKTPKMFKKLPIYIKTDYVAITGKTSRDVGSRKFRYMLSFVNLTKAELTTLLNILDLNQAVTFVVNEQNVITINKQVFPYIGSINYDTLGSSYLSSLELELIEQ